MFNNHIRKPAKIENAKFPKIELGKIEREKNYYYNQTVL